MRRSGMGTILPLAVAVALVAAVPALAQSGGGGGGGGGAGGGGSAAAGGAGGASQPMQGGAAAAIRPPMATSHAQTAQRLMDRKGKAAAAPNSPQVAAASKAVDDAIESDPTVRAMLNGSMSKPPSLAGGSPGLPPPPPSPPQ